MVVAQCNSHLIHQCNELCVNKMRIGRAVSLFLQMPISRRAALPRIHITMSVEHTATHLKQYAFSGKLVSMVSFLGFKWQKYWKKRRLMKQEIDSCWDEI